jgi:hypothetical protein
VPGRHQLSVSSQQALRAEREHAVEHAGRPARLTLVDTDDAVHSVGSARLDEPVHQRARDLDGRLPKPDEDLIQRGRIADCGAGPRPGRVQGHEALRKHDQLGAVFCRFPDQSDRLLNRCGGIEHNRRGLDCSHANGTEHSHEDTLGLRQAPCQFTSAISSSTIFAAGSTVRTSPTASACIQGHEPHRCRLFPRWPRYVAVAPPRASLLGSAPAELPDATNCQPTVIWVFMPFCLCPSMGQYSS